MGTRYVHRVRIKHPTDKALHVDVEVTDAISFLGPDGQETVIDFSRTAIPKPYIVDEVGAGCGVGALNDCTRVSHMEKIARPGDSTQELFIEVLDIVAMHGPRGSQTIYKMPSASSVGGVVDTAGIGITGALSGSHTRSGHTIKVQSKTDPDPTDYIGVVTVDRIGYTGPNGQQTILNVSAYETVDETKYTTDGNGNASPPDNSDPNPYVKFPNGSTSQWVQCGEDHEGVAQGMLWRIVKTNASGEPWWIWTPKYQIYNWSNEGFSSYVGPDYWTVRGFPSEGEPFLTDVYLPPQPSAWLRLPNEGRSFSDRSGGPGPPLPIEGFASADEAADYAHDVDPGAMVKMNFKHAPDRRIPLSGLGFNPNVWQLTGLADKQPFHYDPAHPRDKVYDQPDSDLAEQVATTFDRMWNATTDAYNNAEKRMDHSSGPIQWVNWHDGGGSPYSVPLNMQFPAPPADWAWAVPIVDGETDLPDVIGRWDCTNNNFDFAGGLPPNGWDLARAIVNGADYGYRLWIFHPTTAWPIKVTQLDPAIWNTKDDIPVRWVPKVP